ncbi:Alpha/Beta hydrolase protein [Macrophomina phaseolina]|uniref:Alpha/Beta hydrolase protein n=1 Tax=Macrophomina phaseolina TaxID=35725 RepID=A0ABQ8G0Q2_9PEZI|nr:Alpha/Beta hydrolase protein [Macrophomina phaseolina]
MHMSILSLLFAAVPTLSKPGANFKITKETAETHQCGDACYNVLQVTMAADRISVGTNFDFDFYAVASNFSISKPGDLLKLEPVDPASLTVISGVSVYRIQYVSEDLDGSYVPATGYIALPFSLPETGAFPLIAFSHGTVGINHGCAISNGPRMFDYDNWSILSKRGYALVATDYVGLGPNYTDHKYCAFPAHANDLFHSVTAARQAFGAVLSQQWLSVGHSQGGGAVWKLAEDIDRLASTHHGNSSSSNEASNYLGTVALAPATKVIDMAQLAIAQALGSTDIHSSMTAALLPLLAQGVQSVHPSFNASSLLGPALQARMRLADAAQLCVAGVMGLTLDLDLGDLLGAGIAGFPEADGRLLAAWQDQMAPTNGARARSPVLVVQGLNDTAILPETSVQAWEDACAAGSEVHLMLYPKQSHFGVVAAAAPDWLRWVDGRFGGVQSGGKCTKVTKKAFDYKYAKAEPDAPTL